MNCKRTNMYTLRLPAKMEFFEQFRCHVMGKVKQWGITGEFLFKIELVFEELLTNIILYAYLEEDGEVEVGCSLENNTFCLYFHDWGKPFNPLARVEPDITKGLEDREVGGLGIHLVRHMVDRVNYKREDESNILTVYLEISPECRA